MAKGIQNKGFSVIDAITQCPTSFGRKNKMGSPAQMMQWQKDHAVFIQAAVKMKPEDLVDKFVIGELHQIRSAGIHRGIRQTDRSSYRKKEAQQG